jgi:hypothetical protein
VQRGFVAGAASSNDVEPIHDVCHPLKKKKQGGCNGGEE